MAYNNEVSRNTMKSPIMAKTSKNSQILPKNSQNCPKLTKNHDFFVIFDDFDRSLGSIWALRGSNFFFTFLLFFTLQKKIEKVKNRSKFTLVQIAKSKSKK